MVQIQRILPGQGQQLRQLRLHSVADADHAFAMSTPQLQQTTHDQWEQMCAHYSHGRDTIVVAQSPAGALVGMAAMRIDPSHKLQHTGQVWGVFVAPEWRGQALGTRLMEHIINHGATLGLYCLKLSVTQAQVAAIHLYTRLGFTPYACEPALLYVAGCYVDAIHMYYLY
jgi:ribosomal protein S18 acetylase RimI-like enzyme